VHGLRWDLGRPRFLGYMFPFQGSAVEHGSQLRINKIYEKDGRGVMKLMECE
jgi:hypothetical protein